MYCGEFSATPSNILAASCFIISSCSRAMPPELGGGAVMTWNPRHSAWIGSRQAIR